MIVTFLFEIVETPEFLIFTPNETPEAGHMLVYGNGSPVVFNVSTTTFCEKEKEHTKQNNARKNIALNLKIFLPDILYECIIL